MWLMTTTGFYSVIRWHDGRMCVRARRRADLTRLRKLAPELSAVEVTPGRDYRYRCFCTQEEWEATAAMLARRVDYGNFKSAVAKARGRDRYESALHRIWYILAGLQPGGPYSVRGKSGYPAVPKNEERYMREAEEQWKAGGGFARSFTDSSLEEWEPLRPAALG